MYPDNVTSLNTQCNYSQTYFGDIFQVHNNVVAIHVHRSWNQLTNHENSDSEGCIQKSVKAHCKYTAPISV